MKHYFSKARLKNALWIIVAILMVLWWSKNQINSGLDEDTGKSGIPLIEVNEGTVYHYDEDGNNDLILTTKNVEYYHSDKGTVFHQPHVRQMKENTTNQLSANLAIENKEKTQLDLQGNVKIIRPDPKDPRRNTVMETAQAYYFIDKEEADTDERITIVTPDSTTHGQGAYWNLNTNLFKLKNLIRSKYETNSSN